MKNKIFIFASLFLFSLGLQAVELKVGYVKASKVLERAPQAKAAQARIDAEFAPRNAKLLTGQRELKKMEEQLARDAAIMSEEKRKKLERGIVTSRRDLKRLQEEIMEDFNIRRNEELRKFQKLVKDSILTLAREENFDLILTEGVLYSSDKADITDLVLKRLESLTAGEATK